MEQATVKTFVLAVLTAAAGILNAYLWKRVVFAGGFGDVSFYSLPALALLLFAILFALLSAFVRPKAVRITSAVVALATGYIFIPYSSYALWTALASAAGGWYAADRIAGETAASITFSVRKIFSGGLPIFFTAVALMLAAFYFSSLGGRSDEPFIPKTLFDVAIPFLEQPLQNIFPGFRSNASVDEFLLTAVGRDGGSQIDIAKLSKTERDQLLREARAALTRQFGITLTGEESASDVIYRVTNTQVAKLVGPYEKYLPLLATVGFFLAVKALTLPVYWVTLILLFVVVKLLVALNVLKKEKVMVATERINL